MIATILKLSLFAVFAIACSSPQAVAPRAPVCPAAAVAPPPPAAAAVVTAPAAADLASLGLQPYPELAASAAPALPKDWFHTTPLSDADIAADFSNLDDLAWLEPIAKQNRVFLFGESHYYQVTHHLGARVLFALNHYDHYGLLTVEDAYSLGPFMDYYATLADDAAAAAFFDASLKTTIDVETGELLGNIRNWNRAHANHPIHVGAHDLEHDRDGVVRRVLAPYFAALGPTYTLTADDSSDLVTKLAGWLPAARAHKLVGAYPFVDVDYITRVIANLRSTGLAYADDGEFSYYRQQAIVRNLTDATYLGRYFRTGKVMVWAGGHHVPTRMQLPDGGNFLREGAYLSHDFAPTKGKAYSVTVMGFAYSLGEMATVDPATIGFVGTGYRDTLTKLQAGYKAGVVDPARAYFTHGEAGSPFTSLVIALGARANQSPVLVSEIAWDAISAAIPPARAMIAQQRRELGYYDALVVVPRSPITRHR